MAKDIPLSGGITDPAHDRYREAAEVRGLIDTDPDVRTIYETARGLEGLVRNAGVHACAVIMSSEPLIDSIPLWRRPQDGAVITGWDYPSCEAIGLLKMDFLGLRNLTIIGGDCIENIKANRGGIDLDLETVPLDDPAAYELLGRGDTLGVFFQLDGGPMRDLLRRMQPTGFEDVVAVIALYRPGPMGMNAHNDYADRKNNRQNIKPIHPELEEPLREILAETYGLIVYQEQIMRIAQKVAGFSLARADILRKAMGKKKRDVLEKEFEGFSEGGMKANGFSAAAVKACGTRCCRSPTTRSTSPTPRATAWCRTGRPISRPITPPSTWRGLLTSVGDDKDKAAVYLADCRRLGITVLRPTSTSRRRTSLGGHRHQIRARRGPQRRRERRCVADQHAHREGQVHRFLGLPQQDRHRAVQQEGHRVADQGGGAFDSLGGHPPRKGLFLVHTDAVDSVLGTKKAEAMGQFDLFGGADSATDAVFTIKVPDEEWEDKHKLALEREMLGGLYVSGHPLNGIAHLLAAQVDTQIPAILDGDVANETQVRIGGILASVNRRVNKNGLPWASAQVEDLTGGIEVLFFPQTYSMFGGAEIADDVVVLVGARVAIRDDRISLIANELVVPDFSSAQTNRPVAVSLPTRQCTVDKVSALKQVLARHPGTAQVHLRLISGGAHHHAGVGSVAPGDPPVLGVDG